MIPFVSVVVFWTDANSVTCGANEFVNGATCVANASNKACYSSKNVSNEACCNGCCEQESCWTRSLTGGMELPSLKFD